MPILSTGAYTQTAYSGTPATQDGALRPASPWPVLHPSSPAAHGYSHSKAYTSSHCHPHSKAYTSTHGYPHPKAYASTHCYPHSKAYTSTHGYPHSKAYTSTHGYPHPKAYASAHGYPHSKAYASAHGDSRTLQPLWRRQCGGSKPAGLPAHAYACTAMGPDTDTHAYPRTHTLSYSYPQAHCYPYAHACSS